MGAVVQLDLFRLTFRFNRRVFGDHKQNLDKNITMKIYEDVFSGDEMFSDTYPIKLAHDCLWEVTGKHISRTQDDIQLAGSNASAEEAEEGTDSASESGVDIILNHRLVETGFGSKKEYTVYLKDYMKKVLGKFKDLQFYTGESMDPSAMI